MQRLRVDHVSIAVPEIDRALDFFLDLFPAHPVNAKREGYDDQFRWADFAIGDFKIELIESARPGSFVERFLERRGPGFHHWSLEIERLAPALEALEENGFRIVDRYDGGDGHETAFIHPRSAFGVLIQFWQAPELASGVPPSAGGVVDKHGTRWRVDHLSIAAKEMAPVARFLCEHLGARVEVEPHVGYDGSFRVMQTRVGDYRVELMENSRPGGFLERFLARRGPGLHHLSIDVEDLDRALEPFERRGVRIVDRLDYAPGWRTAFLHPSSTFGILVQFWQTPALDWRDLPR